MDLTSVDSETVQYDSSIDYYTSSVLTGLYGSLTPPNFTLDPIFLSTVNITVFIALINSHAASLISSVKSSNKVSQTARHQLPPRKATTLKSHHVSSNRPGSSHSAVSLCVDYNTKATGKQ